MPKATATLVTERHNLKTVPDGFVEVRRLTYGETLQRRQMMTLEMTGNNKNDARAEMALANRKATEYDFARCITNHNLFADDQETRKLNLGNPSDVDLLDPRVGQEIESILDALNNFEPDQDAEGNSSNGSGTSSS
jgi:hypothetical protein